MELKVELKKLTIEMLNRAEVWEFICEDEVEFVVSTNFKDVPDEEEADTMGKSYISHCDFILNDSTLMSGFISPQDDSGLDYMIPTIILDGGAHVPFFTENFEASHEEKYLELIGKPFVNIFPINVKSVAKCNGKTVSFVIENFDDSICNRDTRLRPA